MTAAPYNYSYIFKYIIIGESPRLSQGGRLMSTDHMFLVLKIQICSSSGRQ